MIYQYYRKRFTIEIAKANRKCRGNNCNDPIKKGTVCMCVNQLEEVLVNKSWNGRNYRIVNKKLSFCPKCSVARLTEIIEGIEIEKSHFEKLLGKVDPFKEKRYRGLIVGKE